MNLSRFGLILCGNDLARKGRRAALPKRGEETANLLNVLTRSNSLESEVFRRPVASETWSFAWRITSTISNRTSFVGRADTRSNHSHVACRPGSISKGHS